ncbi:ABC-2 type transport system permease protein [Haloactinospora alba]|uniref:ABC-2 type transport system permease protein n=1 Tax=Haloactinospora alba TaxID=405555 RepID=A0A543NFU3_9ACTN|nr:ABC transporter permease subunit [Haloactinospora alba]TQN30705.1 ABC-2 type transport system permease protein [Haloactinospora alba]
MQRDVFGKFLRDHLRALVGWFVAVVAVTALYSSFWPAMEESAEAMDAYMEAMPQGVMEAMGWSDMTSPEGYLNATVFGILTPVLMVIAAIMVGTRAIAGEEEEGGLELLLAHPVSRGRVVLQRFAALVAFLVVLGAGLVATLLLLSPPTGIDIAAGRVVAAGTAVTLLALAYGSVALAIGAATGRRAAALAGAALLAAVGYLGNTFALQVEELEWLRFLSPFYYAQDPDPLNNGLDAGFTGVLVAVAVVLAGLALAAFSRRDVLV